GNWGASLIYLELLERVHRRRTMGKPAGSNPNLPFVIFHLSFTKEVAFDSTSPSCSNQKTHFSLLAMTNEK
ncbi:MAG: hypothetical protein ACREA9_24230, partial [Pyrinomonadaceae bacterium]